MEYKHIIKSNIKNIYIKVDKNSNVTLVSSHKRKKEAIVLLKQKEKWIKSAIKKNKNRIQKDNIYLNNGFIYFFGDKYPLKFIKSNKDKMEFDKEKFIYYYKQSNNCQKFIEKFYKFEIDKFIKRRVDYFSKKMSLYPKDIKYRKMKRRLGSCSFDNNLTFNYLIAKLFPSEIDYIIVHELAHIKEKNHSKNFWNIVAKEFPLYKEIRKNIIL